MKTFLIVIGVAVTIHLFSCQPLSSNPKTVDNQMSNDASDNTGERVMPSVSDQDMPENATITVSGIIEYKKFEGGFFAFIANDGRQFTPQGLNEQYRQHGLLVTLTGKPMPDLMTITQFGTVFKVEAVTEVDDSNVKTSASEPINPADL